MTPGEPPAARDASAVPTAAGPAAEAYTRWAPEVAGVLAEYLGGMRARPVGPSVEPGWLLGHLPEDAPEDPEDFAVVLDDVAELILPAMVNWQAPGFHAYFPANTSWPAALADFLAAGLGQQGMLWATSPAATELEMAMLDWVARLCGLPEHFRHATDGPGGGVIQDSASSGTLVAVLAGRERAGGRDELHRQTLYTSAEAHSSVVKGARIAGFSDAHIREVPCDDTLAMRPDALEEMMAEDVAAGRLPAIVVATLGTTSTMALDPVRRIAAVAAAHPVQGRRAWVHVDAAMAGGATICAEHRDLLEGVELVDSYLFNPHKWWGVTFDCTTMWLADRSAVLDALSITPPYLRNESTDTGAVVDFRDWQVPLGRRFRSLKLWFVLRAIGAREIATMVRRHVAEAGWLAEQVRACDAWEIAAPPVLNLVCVRHRDGDDATRGAAERINASGRALVTLTEVSGHPVLRLSIGSPSVTHTDVAALWDLLDHGPERDRTAHGHIQ